MVIAEAEEENRNRQKLWAGYQWWETCGMSPGNREAPMGASI